MFSENQKISLRQIKRILILNLFGTSSLLLPQMLAEYTGMAGVFCIVIGTVVAGMYWKIFECLKIPKWTFKKHSICLDLCQIFFLLYFVVTAAFTLKELVVLICENLLADSSIHVVLFCLLVAAFYIVKSGIEGEGRIYEVLFWFVFLPLLFMLCLTFDGVNPQYFQVSSEIAESQMLKGIHRVLILLSPSIVACFFQSDAAEQKGVYACAGKAVWITGGFNLVLYLILTGTFQVKTTMTLRHPVITLMRTVRFPLGFVSRMDAFMTAIWFFALFSLLHSSILVSEKMLHGLFTEKMKRFQRGILCIGLYFCTLLFFYYEKAGELYWQYMTFLILPVFALLPLFAWVRKKRKLKGIGAVLLCPLLFFNGCASVELEKRSFPLAIAVDKSEAGIELGVECPDFAQVDESKQKDSVTLLYSLEAKNYYDAEEQLERNKNTVFDYMHVKTLLLGKEFFQDTNARKELLSWIEKEETAAENTCLLISEERANDFLQDKGESKASLGTYLEEMVWNQKYLKRKAIVTAGQCMNQWHNQNEILLVPVLARKDGNIVIQEYLLCENFEYCECIPVEEAEIFFLCQNLLKKLDFTLKSGEIYEIKNLRVKKIITAGHRAEVTIYGEAKQLQGNNKQEIVLNRQLKSTLEKYAEKWRKEGIDITNSLEQVTGYNFISEIKILKE